MTVEGIADVVGNVWPEALVQTCILHLIRNTFHLASKKDWDALKRDLRPIYTAPNPAAARAAFDDLLDPPLQHPQPSGVAPIT